MPNIIIYHNPRCMKSRQTLKLLEKRGIKPKIIEYLKTPPSEKELDTILNSLKLEPEGITRKKEDAYTELGLKEKKLSRKDFIKTLVKNPILIERPIVVNGNKAALGRPPEDVLRIL